MNVQTPNSATTGRAAADGPATDTFSILTVCTGNICRSPAVERLLRSALGPASGVEVTSAGTGPIYGEPIHEPMAALLRDLGVDTTGFTSRLITERMIGRADLVLTLTREHRARVVELVPAAVRRVFTLRELARLAEQVDPADLDPTASPAARLRALVPLAARYRQQVPAELDDVVDPFRQPPEVFQRALDQIRPAVATIANLALGRPAA
ncbi:low molecular weight phosphatase family protein [Georgenia sp. TF02-10]|uniref:arsenate reductase/protein-tyrosine-phosphatase family protein n=1 Tax=Georgenia sp. TF02-10 TaxID=2917725 RepID=UPI001FA70E2E|nr:low molecular weight phosphatase family protein [Georgenia sp. TF02-10]UNX55358.1 low molecular weight phosphatase family protein [Georgenia sp. TF02-10]